MQTHVLLILVLSLAWSDGFIFSSKPKCPIKKAKSFKHIVGNDLYVHENFQERVKSVDEVAKACKVHVYVKGSYYQLANPSQNPSYTDYDLVVGHGFRFELRDEKNAMLCNHICLSRNPGDMPEAKCFLQGISSRGLVWSRLNSDVISDGTYSANVGGYQTLKNDVQTRCKDEKFKRALLRALRRMYDEDLESEDQESDDQERK